MEIVIPIALIAFFIPFFMLLVYLFSRMGWQHLEGAYSAPEDSEVPAKRYRFTYAVIGTVRYRGVVHLGADDQYLYMSTILGFCTGHTPLRIPWKDLHNLSTKKIFFLSSFEADVGRSRIRIQLPIKLLKYLSEDQQEQAKQRFEYTWGD